MTELEQIIGYTFKNPELLKEALTHSSYTNGKHLRSNERLEFLGDSVLSIVVSEHLFENLTNLPEGQLTKIRASVVCENALYPFARKIDLGKYIFLGKGEEHTGGRDRHSILADAFEALIAAIYLDGGFEAARSFILPFIPPLYPFARKIDLGKYIFLGKGEEHTGGRDRHSILADAFEALIAAIYLDGGFEAARSFILPFIPPLDKLSTGKFLLGDYKTVLQEIIQQNPEERVTYEISDESGQAHNKQFTANVLLNGQIIGTGKGKSKKEAEQSAAKEAISLMGYETN